MGFSPATNWSIITFRSTLSVIGGVIALLFAPQSGKETRQMIKDKAAGVAEAIKGKAADAAQLAEAVKEKTAGAVHALKS